MELDLLGRRIRIIVGVSGADTQVLDAATGEQIRGIYGLELHLYPTKRSRCIVHLAPKLGELEVEATITETARVLPESPDTFSGPLLLAGDSDE